MARRSLARSGGVLFEFLDRWTVPLPPESVFDLLARPRYYPLWWHGGFVACPQADPGEPGVGKRATLVVRGFLPYELSMTTECIALERPARIVARSSGELVGRGEWTLRASGKGTAAEFDWRVEVTRPLERRVAPVLGPLLSANHAWTMRLGRRGIVRHGPAVLAALEDSPGSAVAPR